MPDDDMLLLPDDALLLPDDKSLLPDDRSLLLDNTSAAGAGSSHSFLLTPMSLGLASIFCVILQAMDTSSL